jgi:hypothetical protein
LHFVALWVLLLEHLMWVRVVIESPTCGTTDMWGPHISDSMAPRMAPSNVIESESKKYRSISFFLSFLF